MNTKSDSQSYANVLSSGRIIHYFFFKVLRITDAKKNGANVNFDVL